MVKGLYTAYTGMMNQQKRLDVVTNNLANADTNGFKKEGVTSQSCIFTYCFNSVGISIESYYRGFLQDYSFSSDVN